MFPILDAGPVINTLAGILAFLSFTGVVYLLWAKHHFRSRTARDHAEEFRKVQDIDILAQKYGNLWFMLFGATWFLAVLHMLLSKIDWWKAVYRHAEWTFKVAEKFYKVAEKF